MKILDRVIGSISAIFSAGFYSAENLLLFNVRQSAHPFFILVCCSFIQTILLIPLVIIARQSFTNIRREELFLIIFTGFLGSVAHIGFALAIFSIGPGNATLIFYTEPIFTILLSVVFLKINFRWTDAVFATTAFSAVVVISLPSILENSGVLEDYDRFEIVGVVFALLGAAMSAGGLVSARKVTENQIGILVISFSYSLQYLICTIILCTIFSAWQIPDNASNLILTFLAGFVFFLAVLLKLYAINNENPTSVSVILTSEVVMTYLGDFIFFSNPLHWTTLVATALVVSSCIGVIYTHDETTQEQEESENILNGKRDQS